MRFIFIFAFFLIVSVALLMTYFVSQNMGSCVPAERALEFSALPNYENAVFKNEEAIVLNMTKQAFSLKLARHLFSSPCSPEDAFPQVKLSEKDFSSPADDCSVRWLGHSSMIFEIAGKRFLVDPVFGNASPVPFVVSRYCESPLSIEEVPDLDFVLITHDHYDHLEYSTICELRSRKNLKFVTMLGVGEHLKKWGVPADQIVELNWGEKFETGSLVVRSVTSRHFSGRTIGRRDSTLWGAFIFEGAGKKIFFGADGGYGKHFSEIGNTHGPFDLVCLEIDAWNKNWPNNHMFPQEAVLAFAELRGKLFLPIHWGVFDLAMHPWNESIEAIAKLSAEQGVPVAFPKMGEKFCPCAENYPRERWWKTLK